MGKAAQRYWASADQATQDFLLPAIDQYYRGKDQVQRDEAMRSCGIAAQTLMLAAKARVMIPALWMVLILKK